MYLQYCLIAVATIFVLSLFAFYIMKKNNQANRKNTVNLVLCTILSIISAILTPLLAKYFLNELSFSIFTSLIIVISLFLGLALAAFYLLQPSISKWADNVPEEADENKKESIVEKIIVALTQKSVTVESDLATGGMTLPIEKATVTQNAAITKEIIANEVDSSFNEAVVLREISPTDEGIVLKENEIQNPIEQDLSIQEKQPAEAAVSQYLTPIPAEDLAIENPETIIPTTTDATDYSIYEQSDIFELLDRAIEYKNNRDYKGAIKSYETALILSPEDELCFLIILDLCSLYKKTNQSGLAYKLLESNSCKLLDFDIKADILRNIKIY